MACISCNADLDRDNRFCNQCGTEQTRLVEQNAPTSPISEKKAEMVAISTSVSPITVAEPGKLTEVQLDKLHARLTHANLCRLRGQWNEAIEYCVQVLQMQPGNATAHSLLGDIYAGQGKIDDAVQWYRMAIDLKPNASDSLKMKKLELERDRLLGGSLRRGGGALLAADGGAMAGTTNLIGGVTPRRWLNMLTGIALAFVGTTVIGLVVVQFRHNHPTVQQAKLPNGMMNDLNRFPNQNSAAIAPVFSAGSTTRGTLTGGGGGGFGADRPQSSTTMTPAPTAPPTGESGYHGTPAPGYAPPADSNPVYKTKPLPQIPAPPNGQGGASVSGSSVGQQEADPTQLPGGMYVASTTGISSENPSLQIVAQNWHDSEHNRLIALRNVFRVAQKVFGSHRNVSQISISVIAEGGTEGNAGVLQAEINRSALNGVNVEVITQEQGEQLASVRWLLQKPQPDSPSQDQYGSIEVGK